MSGVNKCILVGNCGQDPEMRFMPQGGAVTNLSIATSESWKDKQTGQQQERTEWHRVVFFNRLAEIAGEYLKKGSKVYIEGQLRTRKWQDQSGQDKYTTEIVASEMQMLDSKVNQDPAQQGQYQQAPKQAQHQPQRPQGQQPAPVAPRQQGGYAQAPRQAAPQQHPNSPPQNQPMGAHQAAPQQHAQGLDDFDRDIPF